MPGPVRLECLGLGAVVLQRRLVGPRHVLLEEGLLLHRSQLILEERRPQDVRVPRLTGVFGLPERIWVKSFHI